jgi:hypothetical protein
MSKAKVKDRDVMLREVIAEELELASMAWSQATLDFGRQLKEVKRSFKGKRKTKAWLEWLDENARFCDGQAELVIWLSDQLPISLGSPSIEELVVALLEDHLPLMKSPEAEKRLVTMVLGSLTVERIEALVKELADERELIEEERELTAQQ